MLNLSIVIKVIDGVYSIELNKPIKISIIENISMHKDLTNY